MRKEKIDRTPALERALERLGLDTREDGELLIEAGSVPLPIEE